MDVELLHIEDCPSWVQAEGRLIDALSRVGSSATSVHVVTVKDAEQAVALNFAGSPTILVDGTDLFPDGSRAGDLACRIYWTPTGIAGLPTTEQIVQALAGR